MKSNAITDEEILAILGSPPVYIAPEADPEPEFDWLAERLERVGKWLVNRIEIDELRKELTAPRSLPLLPEFVAEATAFFDSATPQHECWEYASPQATWDQLAARAGYALVLDGKVTSFIETMVS